MWILSSEGNLFAGKRMWLAPGSTHLFGRTTAKPGNGERNTYIENKSVSRKHLTITVLPVVAGSGAKLHERSKVQIKDGSKIGTYVNGRKIVGTTEVLTEGVEYNFRLGSHEHKLHLKWVDVVLCHCGGSKKQDVFAAQRPLLEKADIKFLKDYVSNKTTHSVAKKRNTAANLQALVQGKWVVGEKYVHAVCEAVRARPDRDETSALEADFDGNWPKEKNFVPSAGGEPVQRDGSYYLPKPERVDVFSDLVFLFLWQSQYDNLLSVVTSGSGKALLWEYEQGESKVEELMEYVKEVAGHKGSGQFRLTQQIGAGGVVLVRPSNDDDGSRAFMKKLEGKLCQRGIEQNELLDTILTLETGSLRQPLESPPSKAPSPASARDPTPTAAQRPQRQSQRAVEVRDSPPAEERQPQIQQPTPQDQQQQQEEEQPAPTRRRHRRYITQSRFKGFDDDFDPSQFSKPASKSPAPSLDQGAAPSQAPSAQGMDVDEPSETGPTRQSARKRPRQPVEEPDEEAFYAKMMPGRAAAKRLKTETAARNGDREASVAENVANHKASEKKKKAKRLDVMEQVKRAREKEDEERRKDDESLQQAMQGVDISELKNLVKVEEMEMPVRERPVRNSQRGADSQRWDERWNGRKNFKKFRPQGSSRDGPRLQRVIVSLEEVSRKGQGIGDEYWLQTSRSSNKKSQSKSQSQSQSRSQATRRDRSQRSGADGADDRESRDAELEDPTAFRRRIEASRREDAEEARGETILPEEIAGRARDDALTRAARQNSNITSTPSQTMRAESQRNGKRPASGVPAAAAPAAKRARQTTTARAREREREREVVDLDDDDDDELKFRRRR